MQCGKCGTALEEGMIFCPKCGTMAEVELTLHRTPAPEPEKTSEEPVAEEPVAVEVPVEELPEEPVKKTRRGFRWIWPGIAVLLVAAAAIAVIALRPQPYTSALDIYIEVAYEGELSKMDLLVPEEYWDYRERIGKSELNASIKVFRKENELSFTQMEDSMRRVCGEDMEVTYEVTSEEVIEEDYLDRLRTGLEKYGIEPDLLKTGYIIDYDLHFSGSRRESQQNKTQVLVLLIGNRWYLARGGPTYWDSNVEFFLSSSYWPG